MDGETWEDSFPNRSAGCQGTGGTRASSGCWPSARVHEQSSWSLWEQTASVLWGLGDGSGEWLHRRSLAGLLVGAWGLPRAHTGLNSFVMFKSKEVTKD